MRIVILKRLWWKMVSGMELEGGSEPRGCVRMVWPAEERPLQQPYSGKQAWHAMALWSNECCGMNWGQESNTWGPEGGEWPVESTLWMTGVGGWGAGLVFCFIWRLRTGIIFKFPIGYCVESRVYCRLGKNSERVGDSIIAIWEGKWLGSD